jgi:hypothetical protein
MWQSDEGTTIPGAARALRIMSLLAFLAADGDPGYRWLLPSRRDMHRRHDFTSLPSLVDPHLAYRKDLERPGSQWC